jgi:hypothetical protein
MPHVWGYKFGREVARRMPHFRGEPAALHPAFATGVPASVVELAEGPIALDAPRIVYSDEDERAIEAFVRARGAFWLGLFLVLSLMGFFFGCLLSKHDVAFGEPLCFCWVCADGTVVYYTNERGPLSLSGLC